MKVLITGGAGFIGSHIAAYFHERDQVVIVDDLSTGHRRNIQRLNVTHLQVSITDRERVFDAMRGVDVVFHLAAMVSVPLSMQRPTECVDVNVRGLLNVLDAARHHGVRKVVHSSSAAVYGDSDVVPKDEDMPPQPISPYGITKLDGEYYLNMYRREYGLPTVSLRYFNVFGPRQDPNSQYAAAVPIFITRALRGEDLVIYGDGKQTRDFVYVEDVVAANVLVAAEEAAVGTYNVGLGGSTTINELAATIVECVGSKSRIVHGPRRPGDVRHSTASVKRLSGLGYVPRFSLADGLRPTIELSHA